MLHETADHHVSNARPASSGWYVAVVIDDDDDDDDDAVLAWAKLVYCAMK